MPKRSSSFDALDENPLVIKKSQQHRIFSDEHRYTVSLLMKAQKNLQTQEKDKQNIGVGAESTACEPQEESGSQSENSYYQSPYWPNLVKLKKH